MTPKRTDLVNGAQHLRAIGHSGHRLQQDLQVLLQPLDDLQWGVIITTQRNQCLREEQRNPEASALCENETRPLFSLVFIKTHHIAAIIISPHFLKVLKNNKCVIFPPSVTILSVITPSTILIKLVQGKTEQRDQGETHFGPVHAHAKCVCKWAESKSVH